MTIQKFRKKPVEIEAVQLTLNWSFDGVALRPVGVDGAAISGGVTPSGR